MNKNNQELLSNELGNFINKMTDMECIPIVFFDNLKEGYSGITSAIHNERIMEYMSDRIRDVLTDMTAYDKDGKLPDSMKYSYLAILNGVKKFLNQEDDKNWALNWEKYKKGEVNDIPEHMLNRFIENGYCPNDEGKGIEIIKC